MLIDWFTVFAQLVNFIILMALLKRFLYQPILDALNAREQKINQQLEDAERIQCEAEQARSEYLAKQTQFETRKSALMQQAQDEAHYERDKLIKAARNEAERLRSNELQAWRHEQIASRHELISRIHQEIFALSRQALEDLASVNLEQALCETFARQLQTLDDAEVESFREAAASSSSPVAVRSAFELPDSGKDHLAQAIRAWVSADIAIEFTTEPDLVCGIELLCNGRKLAWHIADYLAMLEKHIDRVWSSRPAHAASESTDHVG